MISTRTPEGWPNHCNICGKDLSIFPSMFLTNDAPCPHCGSLLWFEPPSEPAVPKVIQFEGSQLEAAVGEQSASELRDDLFRVIDRTKWTKPPVVVMDFAGIDYLSPRRLAC
jgi:hypothetical protein